MADSGKVKVGGIEIDQAEIKRKMQAHFREKVIKLDDNDKRVWDLLANVPRVSKNLSYLCAVLNLVLPGSGTMVAACSASDNVSKVQMTIAVLQFLLTFFLVGFLWAMGWSYLLVKKARDDENVVMQYAGQPPKLSNLASAKSNEGRVVGSQGNTSDNFGAGNFGASPQYNQFA